MIWQEGVFTEPGGVRIERIAIREPVWDGRAVGIASFRAKRSDFIEVSSLEAR